MDEPKTTPEQAPAKSQFSITEIAQFLEPLVEQVKRQSRFSDIYANNFRFEPSVWDFKIVLGELDQDRGEGVVSWHTALTIPWFQVKLLAYFLRLNLAWYEHQNGPVAIPSSVIPTQPISAKLPDDPSLIRWKEISGEIHKQTFGEESS